MRDDSIKAEDQLKAAYSLNLWTISVSQIIDYNDINVLKQEYDNIMNNLNLERMIKDEALLDVIKQIMDTITHIEIDEGDKRFVDMEYQRRLKNAVWTAVPNIGAIIASDNPVVMSVTLATQVGIGYMNYRRNKAEYALKHEKANWEIQKNQMLYLTGLQQQLFETAWRLSEAYRFPEEYRLTPKQIAEYNKTLIEPNAVRRYNGLNEMKGKFLAYPTFWYQLGSTANSIFRGDLYKDEPEIRNKYKEYAKDAFKKYEELNSFNLLRHDVLTSSWALEYLELLDYNANNNPQEAVRLISIAEKYSGNAFDILELCAFAYLRVGDEDNAIRLFKHLVNSEYNTVINTPILSGLYIKEMRCENEARANDAKFEYKELKNITDPRYILEVPADSVDLKLWKPDWNRNDSFEEFINNNVEANNKGNNATKGGKSSVMDKFGLSVEQTEVLYNLEYYKTINDIEQTNTIGLDKVITLKNQWAEEWKSSITNGFASFIGVSDAKMHWYSKNELRTAITGMKPSDAWLKLILLEAMIFEPYYALGTDKDSKSKYSSLHNPLNGYKKGEGDKFLEQFQKDFTGEYIVSNLRSTYESYYFALSETMKSMAKGVGIAVVGVAIAVFTAGTLAPTIAVALVGSNFAGLGGAALTSASLAYLGGGAIAAGGMGMAGGTMAIVGGGALLGGSLGAGAGAMLISAETLGKESAVINSSKLLTSLKEIFIHENADFKKGVYNEYTSNKSDLRTNLNELMEKEKSAASDEKKEIKRKIKNVRETVRVMEIGAKKMEELL